MKRLLWGTILVMTAVLGPAAAGVQAQSLQVWPEMRLYISLTPGRRVGFMARTTSEPDGATEAEAGAYFDAYLKPWEQLKHLVLFRLDTARSRPLVLRLGFEALRSLNGGARREQRALVELTPHFPLRIGILATDRNRLELRRINGKGSWRYRNRAELEKTLRLGRYRPSVFGRIEAYYDSRYSRWVNTAASAGMVFPFGHLVELETYFEHRNDTSQSPAEQTNAVAIALTFFK